MPDAWIQLDCPSCDKHWERDPTDLPGSRDQFNCPHCDTRRSMAEFTRTKRDLELLKEFS